MKIIDLLSDIENDEIEDGTIFEVIGDFFYKLIVIDKNLYCINEMTKQLEILDSKYIGRFDNRQYEIVKLSNKVEEEKKIPLKINKIVPSQNYVISDSKNNSVDERLEIIRKRLYANELYMLDIANTLNEIIDYLKSKGE